MRNSIVNLWIWIVSDFLHCINVIQLLTFEKTIHLFGHRLNITPDSLLWTLLNINAWLWYLSKPHVYLIYIDEISFINCKKIVTNVWLFIHNPNKTVDIKFNAHDAVSGITSIRYAQSQNIGKQNNVKIFGSK